MLLGNIPAPGGGGLEGQVYDLSAGLLQLGVDVEIVCADRLHMPAADHALGDRIHSIPFEQSDLEMRHPYLSNLRLSLELSRAAPWHEYDLVHAHNHYGFYTATALRTSPRPPPALVTSFHLTPAGVLGRMMELGLPEEPDSRIDESVAMMEAAVANLSDRCIAVSEAVRDDLRRRYHVPDEKLTTVYNGIDTKLFRPGARNRARRAFGLDPAGTYLLYIGPFDRFKGMLLLESLPLLDPAITLLVVWPTLDPAARERGGERLRYLGYLPRERLRLLYSACELLAFPAIYAGFGLALAEASACGCVPVAFDQSAANEVVSRETAWLVDEISPGAYAAAINEGVRSPETAEKRERGIISTPARFPAERTVAETLAVYERALR